MCVIAVFLHVMRMHLTRRKVVSIDVSLLRRALFLHLPLPLAGSSCQHQCTHHPGVEQKTTHADYTVGEVAFKGHGAARVYRHNGRDNCFRRLEHSRAPRI